MSSTAMISTTGALLCFLFGLFVGVLVVGMAMNLTSVSVNFVDGEMTIVCQDLFVNDEGVIRCDRGKKDSVFLKQPFGDKFERVEWRSLND